MGTCPNCGAKGWLLIKEKCLICGKVHCTECRLPVLEIAGWSQLPFGQGPDKFESPTLSVCSEKCWNGFWEEIKAIVDKNPHVSSQDIESVLQILEGDWEKKVVKPTILSFLKEKQRKHELHKCWNWYLSHMESDDWYFISESSDRMLQEFREYFSSIKARLREEQEKRVREEREKYWKERELKLLDEARHAERVGRYEDAAHNYEELADHYEICEFYEKARELRDRARQLRGKGRQVVVVDLNKLIQQVKNGGIVVAYRCPSCGGKLEIGKDASVESLKVCKYCGSQIKAMDLANFLRTALS